MRITVTGANGQVGQRLCALLASRGHHVTGLSRGPRRVSGSFPYATCDLTDAPTVHRVLTDADPDVVVHTASMTDVDGCERDSSGAWAANAQAAATVASESRSLDAHLVHVSTDYVFDGERGPYDEEALPNPKGVYSVTKFAGELAVKSLAGSWAIARTAVVYGWPAAGRPNFGSWLVQTLSEQKPVKLFEDQFVSPSLARNVAGMLAELAERRLTGIWNTAGAEVIDRVAFGHQLCELFGLDSSLVIPTRMADAKLPSPRPAKSGLSCEKALAQLASKPLMLADALVSFRDEWRAK